MSNKRKPWTARRIHLWVAIILAIPMVIMAVSGSLIAMRSVTQIQVPMHWLGGESVPERLPITAYLELPGGEIWIGNAQGLNLVESGKARSIAAFAGQEIIGLAAAAGSATPVVATRMSVWAEVDGAWKSVQRGRVRQLSSLADGRAFTIVGGRGDMANGRPLASQDGVNWQPYRPAMQANRQMPALENPKVALHQFMRELHSGAYFFGKGPGEMWWSNFMGWVLVLLSLTGLWMWWRREMQKARERQAQQSTQASPLIATEGA